MDLVASPSPSRRTIIDMALGGDVEKAMMLAMANHQQPRTSDLLVVCMQERDMAALKALARHPLIDLNSGQWGAMRDAIHRHETDAIGIFYPLIKHPEALARLLLEQWQALPIRPRVVHRGLDEFGRRLDPTLQDEWNETFGPACPLVERAVLERRLGPMAAMDSSLSRPRRL
jgi:hypothetical protein